MSDQIPPDQASPTDEQGSVDLSARLASLSAPRPGVTSIWQRREVPAPTPALATELTDDQDQYAEKVEPTLPQAAAPSPGAGIGRLTRVSAAELWTDASAMASWIAANADALSELTGVQGLRFEQPIAGTVLGTTADGSAACVVCEVGLASDEGLGTLLRTAALQDGGTVVWLNGGGSDSHVAAVSWLNRSMPPRFFLGRASGVRIDGSASAPMFELLVRPARGSAPIEETPDVPQRRVEDHVPEG